MLQQLTRRTADPSSLTEGIDWNSYKFLFNAAVLFVNVRAVKWFLEKEFISLEADDVVLEVDPISYAMSHNHEEMSRLLIEYCREHDIYSHLHYSCDGQVMRDLLIAFFEEVEVLGSLPAYAQVQGGVLAITSGTHNGYQLEEESLPIQTDGEGVRKLRMVCPKRPVELTHGCQDIRELVLAFEENMDEDLMDSTAALFVTHLMGQHFLFFVVTSLMRVLLLGFMVAAVYIQQAWAYSVSIVMLGPVLWYEAMTMNSNLLAYLRSPAKARGMCWSSCSCWPTASSPSSPPRTSCSPTGRSSSSTCA